MTDTIGQDASPVFEYLRIIRRRKWLIGFIALLIIAGAVAVAFLLPATYQSTATILIEEPGVSEELAGINEVAFADQRLQLIQQRVMTTAKLIGVIDRLGLYEEVRETTPVNVLADSLRGQIALKLVGADTGGTQNNRGNRATTAFTLSFTARNPVTAQAVTEELVELYLKENERTQRDRALGTAGFLTAESSRLAAQIKDLESQLAQFKTEHAGSLPEELEFNMQLLDRSQTQLLEFMRQAQGVRERQAFLQAQLLSLEPQAPINSNAPETLSPRSRLRLLTSQYGALNAKYGPNHPDVVSLRRQIESLNGSVDGASAGNLQELQASLAVAQEKYGKAHPEVVSLQRQIDAAQQAGAASGPVGVIPDNPAYVQTQGQLNALGSELGMASAQIASLQAKIKEVESRVLKTPEVERTYLALKRDYDTAVAKYRDLQERESQADLAKNLETEQMGERLSLIEPPPLPINPISPNRPAIILLGIVVGMAAGIAAAFLAESLDGRIYGHRGVAAIIGEPPLAFVPRIHTVHDRRTGRQKFAVVMASAILVATTLIVGTGLDLTSLESFWSSLQDQWGKS